MPDGSTAFPELPEAGQKPLTLAEIIEQARKSYDAYRAN
jgi:hypothetical protein